MKHEKKCNYKLKNKQRNKKFNLIFNRETFFSTNRKNCFTILYSICCIINYFNRGNIYFFNSLKPNILFQKYHSNFPIRMATIIIRRIRPVTTYYSRNQIETAKRVYYKEIRRLICVRQDLKKSLQKSSWRLTTALMLIHGQ